MPREGVKEMTRRIRPFVIVQSRFSPEDWPKTDGEQAQDAVISSPSRKILRRLSTGLDTDMIVCQHVTCFILPESKPDRFSLADSRELLADLCRNHAVRAHRCTSHQHLLVLLCHLADAGSFAAKRMRTKEFKRALGGFRRNEENGFAFVGNI